MDSIHLISFFFAMVVFAAIPGPGVLATVSRTLRKGESSAMFLVFGLILGDILYASFAVFGLGAVAQIMGTTFVWVRWISGIYLIFLGYQAVAHKQETVTEISKQSGKSFLIGIFITLGNPKVIVFYLGFLPAFFDMNLINSWGYLEIVGIIALVSILVLGTYIKLASVLVKRVNGIRVHRLMNRLAGTIMVAAGVKVVSS